MSFPYADEYEPQRATPAVWWIVGLCVAVFYLQATILSESAVFGWLGYHAADLDQKRLWTLVTYMFVHGGLMHLAFNMYTLWLFGRRVERAWGSTTFTWFYLWCGVGGWAFHWMFTAGPGVLVGASAAILGVAVAYASRWPDDEIFLFGVVPMKVRWLVVFLAVLSLVMTFAGSSAGGTAYAAHFGGMFAGWLYLRTPNAQSIDRLRRRMTPAPDYGDETPRAVPQRSARPRGEPREPEVDDIVAQSRAALSRPRPAGRTAVSEAPAPDGAGARAALDAVLDKIAARGLDSLTVAERELLEGYSRQLRGD